MGEKEAVMKLFFLMPVFTLIVCVLLLFALCLLRNPGHKKQFRLILIPFFCLSALLLYNHLGAPRQMLHQHALGKISQTLYQISQQPEGSVEGIFERLSMLEGKLSYSDVAINRLGSLYLELGNSQKAITCFELAKRLEPTNTEYIVQWIYAHSLSNQGKLPEEVRDIANKQINTDPTLWPVLNILAVDHFISGEFPQAIQLWRKILSTDTTLSQERKEILQKAIQSAGYRIFPQNKPIQVVLKVMVSVDPLLQAAFESDHTVFIFVKGVGQGPPLAVIKKRASELPFNIELGEAHSMMAGIGLKPGQNVQVVAKISKSGDPLDREGDLRGLSSEIRIKPGMKPIGVVINEKV